MKCRRLEKQFLYGGGGDQFDRPQRQRHRFLFGESFEFVDEPLGSICRSVTSRDLDRVEATLIQRYRPRCNEVVPR